MIKKLLLAIALLCTPLFGQVDIPVSTIGPYIDLARNANWVGSGVGNINNNYIFSTPNPDSGLCLYLVNNDTSSHFFGLSTFVSGDQRVTAYTNNTSVWKPVTSAGSVGNFVAASSATGFFIKLSGAARVVVQINSGSGSGTVSLLAVTTTSGGCASTPYPLTTAADKFTTSALGSSQAFMVEQCVVNPGTNQPIIFIAGNSATLSATIYYQRARFSSTAAGQINVSLLTDIGTGCTNSNLVQNSDMSSGPGATTKGFTAACGVVPNITKVLFADQVAANTPQTIDLSGIYQFPLANTGAGLGIMSPVAITGTVCGTLEWSEIY